jgi:predicted DNA-binding transcriptional regulator YafY
MHARLRLVVTPSCLEYSEKDDRFRLIASGRRRRWTINLSSITQCEPRDREKAGDLEASDKNTQKDPPKASVTFEFHDRRNALERVLLHFSHLEKETKRLDENRYLVTLKYDRQDQTEMVIRILSFGPVIRVTEPESFIILLRDRIERQGLLFK